jgi:hypothetical protein
MRLNSSLIPTTRDNFGKSERWESWDILSPAMVLEPMKIIYQPDRGVTIVIWGDGSKTVVKCHEDEFSKEFGFAMAVVKKLYGRGEFLKMIKNASVQNCNKKKENIRNNPSHMKEYESEEDDYIYKKEILREVSDIFLEIADSLDDLYNIVSKLEEISK